VQLNEEVIVDQLIHMGVVTGTLDRIGLRRDVTRMLRKYYGMPLEAMQTHEVMEEAMTIAFRHHLHLPSELWLLGKTLAMMEGLALKLVPDFDFFAVSQPYVRRFMRHMVSPSMWGPPLLKGMCDFAELLVLIPRVGSQLLTRFERGELEIILSHKELDQALVRLDRSANRLSLSMLLAALIVGLALLIPAFKLGQQWGLATILVITGFVGLSLVGLWLIISIWRSGK
jgi:ubiquinone biosynthesis protein